MPNHSNENEFDLHENKHASETNFHMNGFALRLVLKKRQKSTRKWPNGFKQSLLSLVRIKRIAVVGTILWTSYMYKHVL